MIGTIREAHWQVPVGNMKLRLTTRSSRILQTTMDVMAKASVTVRSSARASGKVFAKDLVRKLDYLVLTQLRPNPILSVLVCLVQSKPPLPLGIKIKASAKPIPRIMPLGYLNSAIFTHIILIPSQVAVGAG